MTAIQRYHTACDAYDAQFRGQHHRAEALMKLLAEDLRKEMDEAMEKDRKGEPSGLENKMRA